MDSPSWLVFLPSDNVTHMEYHSTYNKVSKHSIGIVVTNNNVTMARIIKIYAKPTRMHPYEKPKFILHFKLLWQSRRCLLHKSVISQMEELENMYHVDIFNKYIIKDIYNLKRKK